MAGSRKSTPSRARSSSVTSNASVVSNAARLPKSPAKAPKATSTAQKSPSKSAANANDGQPATPRKSQGAAPPTSSSVVKKLTSAQREAISKRPALPAERDRNPVLPKEDVPVKLQVILREGESIIIGRVKLPTIKPVTESELGTEDQTEFGGKLDHGFLLKRFDTNAIAASSMFKLAFPFADAKAERAEMDYLEQRFNVDVANGGMEKIFGGKRPRGRPSKKFMEGADVTERLPPGSTGVRLQGTWIPCADGLQVAIEYGLERFARPLIEATAMRTEEGVPILTPSATDFVSTPTSGRSKKMLKQALEERAEASANASPSAARKRVKDDKQVAELGAENVALQAGLSSDNVAKQILESQALAKSIQTNGMAGTGSSASRKRRALNQSPSSHTDALDDDAEDYESGNVVVRSFRRGRRVAQRRPFATTAGALGAVGAVGAGTVAWLAGGNLDVAAQIVQQGVSNLSSWFF